MKLKLKRGLLRYVNAIKLSPFLATKIFDGMISLILSYNSKLLDVYGIGVREL